MLLFPALDSFDWGFNIITVESFPHAARTIKQPALRFKPADIKKIPGIDI
jgi:hypothetical protein